MNDFLQDLWSDLREKRLWPVAALLLVGLIAVPVVLSKPTEDPPPAPTAAAPDQGPKVAKGLAALTVAEDDPGEGSTLDVFDPSNPFKPPQDIIANSSDSAAGPDSGAGGTTAADTSGSGGGAVTPTGTGDSGTGAPTGTVTRKTTTQYRYVIDTTLIVNGDKRKIKGMDPLAVLPSHSNALLVFLGVRPKTGNSVFLVDSTLAASATGDGKCKPKKTNCAFLYLPEGGKETFTNEDGDTYVLRVRALRKVKLDDKSSTDQKATAGSDDASGATAELGTESEHNFVPQFLSDLVDVSSGSDESDQTGR